MCLWLLCCAALLSACASPPKTLTLADRFHAEGAASGSDSFAPHFAAIRNGRREDAVRLIAPVTIRTRLAGLAGDYRLDALATQVFNIGDGLQLDVDVVSGGERKRVCERYFDAARKAADRSWIPLAAPFEIAGQADSYLEIRVSGGPRGDLVADWLALAGLRITKAR